VGISSIVPNVPVVLQVLLREKSGHGTAAEAEPAGGATWPEAAAPAVADAAAAQQQYGQPQGGAAPRGDMGASAMDADFALPPHLAGAAR